MCFEKPSLASMLPYLPPGDIIMNLSGYGVLFVKVLQIVYITHVKQHPFKSDILLEIEVIVF